MTDQPLRDAEDPECQKLRDFAAQSASRQRRFFDEMREVGADVNRARAARDDWERRLHGLAMLVQDAEREDSLGAESGRGRRIGEAGRTVSTRIAVAVAWIVGGVAFAGTVEALQALLAKMERDVRERREKVREAERRHAEAVARVRQEDDYFSGLVRMYERLPCRCALR